MFGPAMSAHNSVTSWLEEIIAPALDAISAKKRLPRYKVIVDLTPAEVDPRDLLEEAEAWILSLGKVAIDYATHDDRAIRFALLVEEDSLEAIITAQHRFTLKRHIVYLRKFTPEFRRISLLNLDQDLIEDYKSSIIPLFNSKFQKSPDFQFTTSRNNATCEIHLLYKDEGNDKILLNRNGITIKSHPRFPRKMKTRNQKEAPQRVQTHLHQTQTSPRRKPKNETIDKYFNKDPANEVHKSNDQAQDAARRQEPANQASSPTQEPDSPNTPSNPAQTTDSPTNSNPLPSERAPQDSISEALRTVISASPHQIDETQILNKILEIKANNPMLNSSTHRTAPKPQKKSHPTPTPTNSSSTPPEKFPHVFGHELTSNFPTKNTPRPTEKPSSAKPNTNQSRVAHAAR